MTIVGGGAAGTLTAIHLIRAAARRETALTVVLIDPADRCGRGVAFGATEDQHLLNVPASGMSALPEEPGHFVAWRARNSFDTSGGPTAFVPRRQFGLYLEDLLAEAERAADGLVVVQHRRTRAVGVRRQASSVAVTTSEGDEIVADAVVVATGLPEAGAAWAPPALADSPFFVPDPWAPGAVDTIRRDRVGPADVLLVGTGLTAVDLVLSLTGKGSRPDRSVLAVSRKGRLPRVHLAEPKLAAIPDVAGWGSDLDTLQEDVRRYVEAVAAAGGDWRPAVDGIRFRVATLWERLGEDDRARFLTGPAGEWNWLRHRMAPSSAVVLRELRAVERLTVEQGEVVGAEPLTGGGLRVRLSGGTEREVGWVVNCTGPQADIRLLGNAFLDGLLRPRASGALASVASAGLGLRTEHGRLIDEAGSTEAPIWTLGSLRRGELWESTAVPEIRTQAVGLASAILDEVAPLPRRLEDGRLVSGHHPIARPRDPLGMPLSTTAEAAAAYNAGLERILRLQDGGEDLIREATLADPGFALAHAALAMLGYEAGAHTDVRVSLDAAIEAVGRRGDSRETSFVGTVANRIDGSRALGSSSLMAHIATYPRDVLAVSAAVPTIAFSGVTDVQREAWDLVDGLAPSYGDHWWYISLLAFVRQDQGKFEEAGLLAESALSCEPSSGHAVHAQTHVMYETGQHEEGRVWLDHWVAESGRSASHRAHFSWHAALHELALGDTEAVRRRYYSQLAPPTVTGVRGLVDAASLIWRWRIAVADWDRATGGLGLPPAFEGEGAPPPIEAVLAGVDENLILAPQTPFIAVHAAIALAAQGEVPLLERLRVHCARADDRTTRTVVVPICDAFIAVTEQRWSDAATLFGELLPALVKVGGSAAQREVIEETLLFCLVQSGRADEAISVLGGRLDRRPSPLDLRRRNAFGRLAAGR
ncbi:lycopene cyclase [Nocardioides marmoriginsengisoli]|uniref:Lycopene cyclase n=1 Tax=Nocardioides marmoriginsengisoli TaxID=661483 RepID=A0A3N0CIL8_9ACTN|nr:lycopene cyclase [Nocardioides marmoriginsengisoli]